MAVIGRIRKYSGMVIVVVGIALAGFVLQDFFQKNNRGGMKDFAKINGENISFRDFEAKVDAQVEQMKQQNPDAQVSSEQVYQIRQQVWNQYTRDIIMKEQYDELGLTVTKDELWDLVQGKEPHQYIIQSFTDPKTNQLDRERIKQFINNFDQLQPEVKQQWTQLEKAIKEDRINRKYNSLVGNSYYQPKVFIEKNYKDRNRRANTVLFTLPYSDIKDTNITVTENELKKVYEEHKKEFEQPENSRALDFVVFEVQPSVADMQKAQMDIENLKTELEKTDNKLIPDFVNINSDVRYDSTWVSKGKLPVRIDSAVFQNAQTASVGTIIGPYLENKTYYMAKLMDVQNRPDSIKAKHILIAYQGAERADQNIKRNKAQAKTLADSLFSVLKKEPGQFEDISKKFSNNPTANEKGGDLGWFADGTMVYPFNEACVNAKVGDILHVSTIFGEHIIHVTDKKAPVKKARVAIVQRTIDASAKTQQDAYAKASRFTSENPNLKSFQASAQKMGLNKRTADFVREMDNNLPGIEQAREVVRWAFDEKTKVGDVKDFEMDNMYIVVALKSAREKGIPELDEIKNQIRTIARKDKKVEMLTKKINDAKASASTIEQLAAKLNVKIDTAREVTFASFSLPNSGNEPRVIGSIFNLKKGEISSPIKGERGVYVVKVEEFIEPTPISNYSMEASQQANYFKSRISWEVFGALQKAADIKDNRIFYY